MRINIRGRDQYNRDGVEVSDGLTVAELRTQLTREFCVNTAVESLRLLFRGRLLQDSNALSFYNIEDGSTVHVVVQSLPAADATGSTSNSNPQQSNAGMWSQQAFGTGTVIFPWNALASTVNSSIASALQQQPQSAATQNLANLFAPAGTGAAVDSSQQGGGTFAFSASTSPPHTTAPSNSASDSDNSTPQQLGRHISSFISTAIASAMNAHAATGQPPQPPQPPQSQATTAAAAAAAEAGQRATEVTHVPLSSPQAVVHIHVHCTPDQLDQMPARLRQLASEIFVNHVELQTQPVASSNEAPHANPPTQAFDHASPVPSQPPPSAASAGRAQTWVNDVLQTVTTSLGFAECHQILQGNLQPVVRLREPLQQHLQSRLSAAGYSASAMAQLARQEAAELSQRLVHMPPIQQLMAQSRATARYTGVFERELPNFLQHLLLSFMQHVQQRSLGAMEWGRELRRLVVRYVGMAMSRSALWFEGGSAALRPVVLNAVVQSASACPLLQTMAGMLGPAVQTSLSNWQREYEETVHRGSDAAVFEQVPETEQQQSAAVATPNSYSSVPHSAEGEGEGGTVDQTVQARGQPTEQDPDHLEELARELLNEGVGDEKEKNTQTLE
ncbi:Ubiquitin-like protein [Leptomonas seymouri]|uniref:Ubiquitin-like protein n=1 Tax=Leptomonas seymouri TaxID=5684 RepID=A0A0N0P7Q7_LEPSE|nr:Ubiquitin-like protein [Leptomonas seymouri]|eukprot:KPI88647.1 Ubiquitin-like protein [Leptomonas seymouri]